jgi:hypothetical protein
MLSIKYETIPNFTDFSEFRIYKIDSHFIARFNTTIPDGNKGYWFYEDGEIARFSESWHLAAKYESEEELINIVEVFIKKMANTKPTYVKHIYIRNYSKK